MTNLTAIGNDGKMGKPIKTYPEALEIGVWEMVMKNLDNETRTDGEEVFVVKDLSELIVNIIEFYENNNRNKIQ